MLPMSSLSLVLLECLAPLLAQDAPAPAQAQMSAPPWVVVDSPNNVWHDDISDLQLVVLSDGTYVGSYHQWGHHFSNGRTHVVCSRDHGATWERFAEFRDLHDVSLIEHDDVVWFMGIEGDGPWDGPPVVLCLRDAAQAWVGGRGRIRGSHSLHAAEDTILHAGRVWRSFSRLREVNAADTRTRVFVASAALGSDLQDPASWRWSSEAPLDDPHSTIFMVTPTDGLALASLAGQRNLDWIADVEHEGWGLSPGREKPTWNLLPGEARNSNFVRDPVGGRCYLLSGEATNATVPPDRPRNALALRSSKDFREWDRTEWLHDVDVTPVAFGSAALLVEGDDMAALISFEHPPPTDGRRSNPLTIAFLRVPKFRDRTADTPPLWGPAFPR